MIAFLAMRDVAGVHSGANYTAALCGRARIKGSNSARPVGLADTLSVSDATAWAWGGRSARFAQKVKSYARQFAGGR